MTSSAIGRLFSIAVATAAMTGTASALAPGFAMESSPQHNSPEGGSATERLNAVVLQARFRHARVCWKNAVGALNNNSFLARCKSPRTAPSPEVCAQESHQRTKDLRAAQKVIANQGCSADPDVVDAEFGKATLAAAAAGDPVAQICYVQGFFGLAADQLAAYPVTARKYIDAAYQRGDWRMIELLTIPGFSMGDGPIGRVGDLPVFHTHFAAFRETHLLWLGASGLYKRDLGSTLRMFGTQLSHAQIKNADQWARMIYNKHFKSGPMLTRNPVPCDAF